MSRWIKYLTGAALAVTLGLSCGSGSGGSFKWYGSNPPVPNNTCTYLGKDATGTEVWECTPL